MVEGDTSRTETRSPRLLATALRAYVIIGGVLTALYGLLFLFATNFSSLGGRNTAVDIMALLVFGFGIYALYWGTSGASHGRVARVMAVLVSVGFGIYISSQQWESTFELVQVLMLSLSAAVIMMALITHRTEPERR